MQMAMSLLPSPWKNMSIDCCLVRRVSRGRGWVDAGKTTSMSCDTGLDLLQRSGNFPCAIFRTGVGSDTVHAVDAQEVQWARAPLRGPKLQVLYMSRNCPIDRQRPQVEVKVIYYKVEEGYLGDTLSTAGGCAFYNEPKGASDIGDHILSLGS